MKKYYKVAHANVRAIQKSKQLTSYGLDELLDSLFIGNLKIHGLQMNTVNIFTIKI